MTYKSCTKASSRLVSNNSSLSNNVAILDRPTNLSTMNLTVHGPRVYYDISGSVHLVVKNSPHPCDDYKNLHLHIIFRTDWSVVFTLNLTSLPVNSLSYIYSSC